MNLKIGEELIVIDENLKGELIRFDKETVTLICEDGFEYTYMFHQVYKKKSDGEIEHKKKLYKLENVQEGTEPKKAKVFIKFNINSPVFDLHIEELAPNYRFANDFDMLNFQLDCVREVIFQANIKRVRSIYLVHGVGKGILRKEIRAMLDHSYPDIEYLDGDYQKFGAGATELIIHQFKVEV